MMLFVISFLAATPIQLDEVREASRSNTEVLRAMLEVRRLEEQVGVSKSSALPQVALEGGVSRSVSGALRTFATIPDPTAPRGFRQQAIDVPGFTRDQYSLGLSVSQLLYDGGRVFRQMEQAQSRARAQDGQAEEQKLASEFEAVRRFYELFRSQRTQAVLEASVVRSQLQLDRARALFEAGRAALRDAIDAEVNLGQDQMRLFQQERVIQSAQADLSIWLAQDASFSIVARTPEAFEKSPVLLPSTEEIIALARERRPLLKALSMEVQAASEAVSAARAGYLPRLTASASYVRQSPTADPFFTDLSLQNSVSAGANFSWNVFDGLLVSSQIKQAQHAQKASLLALEQSRRELEAEVARAALAYESQLKVSKVAAANLELAKRGLALAEERFLSGAGSTLEVRDAQLKLLQAELANLESRIDVEVALAALERVAGVRLNGALP